MRSFVSAAAILAVLLAEQVFAGAWTQPAGKGYYQISIRIIRADEFFDPGGNKLPINSTSDTRVSLYGEYGITDRITVSWDAPLQHSSLDEISDSGTIIFAGDTETSFADSSVGLTYGLIQGKPTVVSAGIHFGLPTGNENQENGLLTGDGEFNQLISIQIGHSFWPRPFYATAGLGFNSRTGGYSDEVRFSLGAGYSATQRITLSARLHGVESLENGDDPLAGGIGGLYSNNQSYLAIGGSISCRLTKELGVQFSMDGVAYAQNILAAPAFHLGFSWKH